VPTLAPGKIGFHGQNDYYHGTDYIDPDPTPDDISSTALGRILLLHRADTVR
jgi:hypothetical protein